MGLYFWNPQGSSSCGVYLLLLFFVVGRNIPATSTWFEELFYLFFWYSIYVFMFFYFVFFSFFLRVVLTGTNKLINIPTVFLLKNQDWTCPIFYLPQDDYIVHLGLQMCMQKMWHCVQMCAMFRFCSAHVAKISHQPNPIDSARRYEVGLVLLSMGILIVYMSGASLVGSLGLEHLEDRDECTSDGS